MRIKSKIKWTWCAAVSTCLIGIATTAYLYTVGERASATRNKQMASPSKDKGTIGLPAAATKTWLEEVQQGIEASEYEIRWQERVGAYQSPNRAQNLRFTYFTNGFSAQPRIEEEAAQWKIGLALQSVRKGDTVWPFRGAALRAQRNTAVSGDEKCRIEYINDREGMRQNFIVEKPLSANGKLELTLSAELVGVKMGVTDAGDAVSFVRSEAGGGEVMRYSDLKVYDATQKLLAAHMVQQSAHGLVLVVDDSTAKYPILIDPLSTSSDWSAVGGQLGANFGWSVANGGDVDGDGYTEVIIGAPWYDGGLTDEGRVFLYCGTSGGLRLTADWYAEIDQAYAYFGWSVANAGDVQNNGYSDVLVGAPGMDSTYTDRGAVFMWHGGVGGLGANGSPSNLDWAYYGPAPYSALGHSVSTAGDLNGDSYSDIVMGAPYNTSVAVAGHAYVFHGSASGMGSIPNADLTDSQNSSMFGFAVAWAGDVNNDGYSDVLMSAPYYDWGTDDRGLVQFYLGGPSGIGTGPTSIIGDLEDGVLGYSISSAGDINGDGTSDIIIGAPLYFEGTGQMDEGKVFVYHGLTNSPYLTLGWTAQIDQAGAQFGSSVTMAGDVNGDGFGDIAVGAPYYSNGQTGEGKVFVWFGGASGLGANGTASNPDWSVERNAAGEHFGHSVACAGDINGDGYSDLLVGAPDHTTTYSEEGKAYLYLGGSYSVATNAAWTFEGNQASATNGFSIAAGDVNGDGFSDVIVGSPWFDNGQANEGKAFVFHGSANGLALSHSWQGEVNQAGARFGISVTSGDFNGDGTNDIAIGADLHDEGQVNEGRVFAWMGGKIGGGLGEDGNASNYDWNRQGNQAGSQFGRGLASAGDVDGDGDDELLIGAPQYENTTGQAAEGRVVMILGSASGLGSTVFWAAEGNQAGAQLGQSLASAGDVNADGYSDIIVGALLFDSGQTDEGKVFVWYGRSATTQWPTPGTPATASWTGEFDKAGAQFGASVASAGDVNGDGYGDIIVGAPLYANGQTAEGAIIVWHGGSSGLGLNGTSLNYSWKQEFNVADTKLGISVSSAGDVNGDGASDVIAGANAYDGSAVNEGAALIYLGKKTQGLQTTYTILKGGQAHALFGRSVACAGDVNGDGFSDILVGAPSKDNGQSNEGIAYVYYGNQLDGFEVKPSQWRANLTTSIQPRLRTGSTTQVGLGLTARSFFGRADVKVQYEIKAANTAFNGQSLDESAWLQARHLGATNHAFVKGSLTSGTMYKWRARVKYLMTDGSPQPYSRWIYPPMSAPEEGDFRTN